MSNTLATSAASGPTYQQGESLSSSKAAPIDNCGIEIEFLDSSTSPGDDFFGHVNGKWIDAHPIPAQLTTVSNFTVLVDRNRNTIRELIEDMAGTSPEPGTDQQRIVDFYRAFLDAGTAPSSVGCAHQWIHRIIGSVDLQELVAVTSEPGFAPLLTTGVAVDPSNPERHATFIGPAPLGLPSRDFYFDRTERGTSIRSTYRSYIALLLEQSGYQFPAEIADQVLAFEETIASQHWTREKLRNPDVNRTHTTPAELAKHCPDFPLTTLLEASGLGSVSTILARQLPPPHAEFSEGLGSLMGAIAQTPLRVLKAYCAAQFLNRYADILGTVIDNARYALYERLIRGRAEPLTRWKRAVVAVEAHLGDLIGAQYVANHFPLESKVLIEEITGNLLEAMRNSLMECQWMGEATREAALSKLAMLDTQIGCGARLETYDGLEITSDAPLANEMAAARWKHGRMIERINQPVDRDKWPFVPQTVNASYREERNQIIFPAGILQPPFFDPRADPAVNYGAIGAIMGHEIGHGFDDQGAKYDGSGALRDWWHPNDWAAFRTITERLIDQYDAFRPIPHDDAVRINGRLSLGENIADLAGLELGYRAYRLSQGDQTATVIDGLTGDQRFFLAFAQVWRCVQREEALRNHLSTAPHSPARFRVNGTVRNVDAWYHAFGVKPGMALYLPPEERVRIWAR